MLKLCAWSLVRVVAAGESGVGGDADSDRLCMPLACQPVARSDPVMSRYA